MTLAPAPSATNTVENPATNSSAATITSRLTRGAGSASASRSSEEPARYTRYGGTKGRTQGDRKLIRPANSAARTETSAAMDPRCAEPPFERKPVQLVPVSEVRDPFQHTLTRTSETKGTSYSLILVQLSI